MSIFMKPIIRVGSDECDPENSQKRLLINGLHWLAVCVFFVYLLWLPCISFVLPIAFSPV